MRKFILLFMLVFAMSTSYGQKVYNLDKQRDSISYKATGDFAIHNGKQYIVYLSQRGKYFIIVTSKNGKTYKKYFKTAA